MAKTRRKFLGSTALKRSKRKFLAMTEPTCAQSGLSRDFPFGALPPKKLLRVQSLGIEEKSINLYSGERSQLRGGKNFDTNGGGGQA